MAANGTGRQLLGKFHIRGHEIIQFVDEGSCYFKERNQLYYDHCLISPFLPKGDINYVDIGARNGDSLRELIPFKERINSIICFEPNPEEFQKLKIVCEQNNLKASLNEFAISKESGVLDFVWDEKERNGGLKNKISLQESWDSERKFKCLCWKDFSENLKIELENLNFIKVDTEGSDIDCLMQLQEIIVRNKPNIMIEWFPETEDKIKKFCSEFCYYAINPETFKTPKEWCHNLILLHKDSETFKKIWKK